MKHLRNTRKTFKSEVLDDFETGSNINKTNPTEQEHQTHIEQTVDTPESARHKSGPEERVAQEDALVASVLLDAPHDVANAGVPEAVGGRREDDIDVRRLLVIVARVLGEWLAVPRLEVLAEDDVLVLRDVESPVLTTFCTQTASCPAVWPP